MLRCVANLTWIVVLATAVTAVEVLLEQSCFAIEESEQVAQALQRSYEPLDLSLFSDSIHHWQMKEGRGRNDLRLDPNQVVQIAENLLKYQNADGGWPVNLDWLAVIDVSEVRKIRKNTLGQSTFDNRNTYPQIDYLSQVYCLTGLKRYQEAATRGFEYILREQRPTGGWRGKDVDAITFNDDVMVGIMRLLLKVREGESHYEWLPPDLRVQLVKSLDQGLEATLNCQIRVDNERTAWCQQHDHSTFEPVRARTYELPSITAQESVGVVDFLMQLPDPSAEVIDAIESAVVWFKTSRIEGIRISTVAIDPVRFEGYTAKFDRIVVADDAAPPIWARFYEIESNRPFFCNRDGVKVYQLSEVKLERRVGYGWYGHWPAALIATRYPAWKLRVAAESNR